MAVHLGEVLQLTKTRNLSITANINNGVFPKLSRTFSEFSEFRESDKSLKHELGSIYKDPVSHMCLVAAVVASWSLTQEVAGSSPFTVISNILANSVKQLGKTPLCGKMYCPSVQFPNDLTLW